MAYKLKFSALFLMILFILSCGHNPKPKEVEKVKIVAETLSIAINKVIDDQASFISGMPYNNNMCLSKLDSIIRWKHYASDMDKMFTHSTSLRL